MTLGPFVPSTGPVGASILLLAEAPGSEESARLTPLVGPSGYELRRMLATIGVSLDECRKVNVFSRQPPGNNLAEGYGTTSPSPESKALGPLTLNPSSWIEDAHLPDVQRALTEIAECDPNVVVALGNTACWALGLGQGINSLRGSVHTCIIPGLPRPLKVLPTYHPAAVLRQWDQRVIALADLEKAHVESRSPHFAYDNSELWLAPTLDDLEEFGRLYMEGARICATDVETKRGQITCLSFAPSPDISLAIPFWIEGDMPNYWNSIEEEAWAWRWVARWIESPDIVKVMQNGLFDCQYFIRHGMKPQACTEDTMLAHHSLYSELRKGLGFLGSIYSNTPSWKMMRTFKREELKRDE